MKLETPWSLKALHKLIMTSAVYMQGDAADAVRTKADPDNRLCWRHVPRRLEAEIIRDSLLSASGELDERMFGPSTLDPDMTRRSIYFMVKRSRLVPMMVLFDAPDALQGMDRRVTTTIAPQALLLMNNPTVRAHAEKLAARAATSETPPAEAIRSVYLRTLSRPPTEREAADGLRFLDQQSTAYTRDGKPNTRLRALADLCQVLFCLNEFVYVD